MKILKIAAPLGWIVSTRATNFTGRARSNEQTDWLTKLDGARLAYTEESPKGELSSLDAELLKELRGDSDVSCRSIYGSEREMNVTFTLSCMANHVPHIEHLDEALKKSFVICDLPGKFVDDPAAFKKANPYTPWKNDGSRAQPQGQAVDAGRGLRSDAHFLQTVRRARLSRSSCFCACARGV
jgi:hypothetical protein